MYATVKTKNFAHRGFSARYPENTMLAFQKAAETGCNGIELDIHLTADRQIVILHDEEVDRTTNGHGLVKDMTLAELQALDAGRGEKIPTLGEYLDFVAGTRLLTNIELKNSIFWYEGMEAMVIDMLRRRGLQNRVLFSSFNHYSMARCKELAPEIDCGLLTWDWIIDAGAYARRCGMNALHPEYHNVTPAIADEIHINGIEINAYTVNDRAEIERLLGLGVSGIITNDPELLCRVIQEYPST